MRITVDIDDDVLAAARGLAARDGTSIGKTLSQLVREALARPVAIGKEDRLAALRAAAGTWRDRPFDGATFVDAARGDSERPRSTRADFLRFWP